MVLILIVVLCSMECLFSSQIYPSAVWGLGEVGRSRGLCTLEWEVWEVLEESSYGKRPGQLVHGGLHGRGQKMAVKCEGWPSADTRPVRFFGLETPDPRILRNKFLVY